jgi:hypothetical protein
MVGEHLSQFMHQEEFSIGIVDCGVLITSQDSKAFGNELQDWKREVVPDLLVLFSR